MRFLLNINQTLLRLTRFSGIVFILLALCPFSHGLEWKVGDPDNPDLPPDVAQTIREHCKKQLLVVYGDTVYYHLLVGNERIRSDFQPMLPVTQTRDIRLFYWNYASRSLCPVRQQPEGVQDRIRLKRGKLNKIKNPGRRKAVQKLLQKSHCVVVDSNFVYAPDNVSVDLTRVDQQLQSSGNQSSRTHLLVSALPEEGQPYQFSSVPFSEVLSQDLAEESDDSGLESADTSFPPLTQASVDAVPDAAITEALSTHSESVATSQPIEGSNSYSTADGQVWDLRVGLLEATMNPVIKPFIAGLLQHGYQVVYGNYYYCHREEVAARENLGKIAASLSAWLKGGPPQPGFPGRIFVLSDNGDEPQWFSLYKPALNFQHQEPVFPDASINCPQATAAWGATPDLHASTGLSLQPPTVLQQVFPMAYLSAVQALNSGHLVIYQNNLFVPAHGTINLEQVNYLYHHALQSSGMSVYELAWCLWISEHNNVQLLGFNPLNIQMQPLASFHGVAAPPAVEEQNQREKKRTSDSQQNQDIVTSAAGVKPDSHFVQQQGMPMLDSVDPTEDSQQTAGTAALTEGNQILSKISPGDNILTGASGATNIFVMVRSAGSNNERGGGKKPVNERKFVKKGSAHSSSKLKKRRIPDNTDEGENDSDWNDGQKPEKQPERPQERSGKVKFKPSYSHNRGSGSVANSDGWRLIDGMAFLGIPAGLASVSAALIWYSMSSLFESEPSVDSSRAKTKNKAIPEKTVSVTPALDEREQRRKRQAMQQRIETAVLLKEFSHPVMRELISALHETETMIIDPVLVRRGQVLPAAAFKEEVSSYNVQAFSEPGKMLHIVPMGTPRFYSSLNLDTKITLLKAMSGEIINIVQAWTEQERAKAEQAEEEAGEADPLQAFRWLMTLCGMPDPGIRKLGCYEKSAELLKSGWHESPVTEPLLESYLQLQKRGRGKSALLVASWKVTRRDRMVSAPDVVPVLHVADGYQFTGVEEYYNRKAVDYLFLDLGFLNIEDVEVLTSYLKWRPLEVEQDTRIIRPTFDGSEVLMDRVALNYHSVTMRKHIDDRYQYIVLSSDNRVDIHPALHRYQAKNKLIIIDCEGLYTENSRVKCNKLLATRGMAHFFAQLMSQIPGLEIPVYKMLLENPNNPGQPLLREECEVFVNRGQALIKGEVEGGKLILVADSLQRFDELPVNVLKRIMGLFMNVYTRIFPELSARLVNEAIIALKLCGHIPSEVMLDLCLTNTLSEYKGDKLSPQAFFHLLAGLPDYYPDNAGLKVRYLPMLDFNYQEGRLGMSITPLGQLVSDGVPGQLLTAMDGAYSDVAVSTIPGLAPRVWLVHSSGRMVEMSNGMMMPDLKNMFFANAYATGTYVYEVGNLIKLTSYYNGMKIDEVLFNIEKITDD